MRIQPKLAVLACSGGRYTLSSHPTSTDNSIKPQGLTRVSFHIYLILTSENHWVFEQVPSLPCLRSDCFSASGKERNTCCTTEKQTFTYRSLFYSQTVWAGNTSKVFLHFEEKRDKSEDEFIVCIWHPYHVFIPWEYCQKGVSATVLWFSYLLSSFKRSVCFCCNFFPLNTHCN